MSAKSFESLSFTSCGTGCFAAAAASEPNLAVLFVGACCTTPREIVIVSGSTFQRSAAAATSIARAAAPALRICS